MWHQIRAVIIKEWLDAVRDRRSLVSALVYAVVGPLLVVFVLHALGRTAESEGPFVLAVAGAERAPSLTSFLERHRVRVSAAPEDRRRAVHTGEIDLALVIPDDFDERFAALRPATVYVEYDSSRGAARRTFGRLRGLLEQYSRDVAATRLVLRGVWPAVVSPVQVRERDVSTGASRAVVALAALPVFLLIAPFISSMNLAIDATAGERERGSLESLLSHPVRRSALATGKWVPAVAVSFLGAALTLGVAQAALHWGRFDAIEAAVGIAWADTGIVLAVILPLALLAPAVQMLVAMFSRSYKEAQTYLSLLLFLPMIPGFLFAFGTWQPAHWMHSVPVIGQYLMLERVLRGDPVGVTAWLLLAATTMTLAAACVATTARAMGHERIVFGR